jgi:hypothetical protein
MNKTLNVPFKAHPFDPEADDPPLKEGFTLVRGMDLPIITRRSHYPFSELRLHDAIVFDTARELKNALQASRTYKKHQPKFKVSGRRIHKGQYKDKFALIRVQ